MTYVGHGHVRPRKDGAKARCGGPSMCMTCFREQIELASDAAANPPRTFAQNAHILKYHLQHRPETVPAGRVVLVNTQHGKPCAWVRVVDGETQQQKLTMVGTGWDHDPTLIHVGSFLSDGDVFVWHVFSKPVSPS